MQAKADFHFTERAIDALARGETILLEGVALRAGEMAEGCPLPPGAWLVISPARAAYLRFPIEGAVHLDDATPDCLKAALYATKLTSTHPKPRKADALDLAALWLVRRAGFLPVAVMGGEAAADAQRLSLAQAEAAMHAPKRPMMRLPETKLPIKASVHTRVVPFREPGGETHLALLIGEPETMDAPLTRLHSSCITGDLLGSLRCDCGDQLHLALETVAKAGGGMVLYLEQEGRGIGLANKMRAYALQDQGHDTLDANHALGFDADERDFTLAARMLESLGIPAIRLLTNNPAKVDALKAAGVRIVERVPLRAEATEYNARYLATKRDRMGHQE